MDIPDATLLRKWQRSSDSEAFAIIVARHSTMVFATCNRILRNTADAEDVTQECFMELGGVRKLVGNSLGGLLHTLATHRSLDRLKRESRRREREIRYAMGRPTSCTVGWDDIYPHIDAAIANLPMKYRDSIIRHFLEGQTHAEIASALCTADSTVRYRINKGIERVRMDLHHRGVLVSAAAMDTMLVDASTETITPNLTANLGKLSLAGAGKASSTTAAMPRAERTLLVKKVIGITAVVAFVTLAGLFAWNRKSEHPTTTPGDNQANSVPLVQAPATGNAVPESELVALDEQPHTPMPAPTTELTAKVPPVESRVHEIALPERKVIVLDEQSLEPMPARTPEQAAKVPTVESPMPDSPVPENNLLALGDDSLDPMPAPTIDTTADLPPVESPVAEESDSEAASPVTVVQTEDSMPETGPFTVATAMEPIRLELPEAFFGGTPLDYWGPNLEQENYKDRPDFMAPKGTAVISKGKAVKASIEPTVGALMQLTDGDKDYAKTSVIELPEGLQWVQIDLEKTSEIYAVLLWHFHEGKRIYFDLVAQVSDDPEFKTGVTTIYNNDFDNSAGLGVGEDKEYIESNKGRLIDARGVKGRYLRVYGKGSTAGDFNHFIEVEVWGK